MKVKEKKPAPQCQFNDPLRRFGFNVVIAWRFKSVLLLLQIKYVKLNKT